MTTVSVGTQVSGMVAEIDVDFNDLVAAGQVVARLDTTLLETAVRDAEAQLARTEAERLRAERDHARTRRKMLKATAETLDSSFDLRSVCDIWSVNREKGASRARALIDIMKLGFHFR